MFVWGAPRILHLRDVQKIIWIHIQSPLRSIDERSSILSFADKVADNFLISGRLKVWLIRRMQIRSRGLHSTACSSSNCAIRTFLCHYNLTPTVQCLTIVTANWRMKGRMFAGRSCSSTYKCPWLPSHFFLVTPGRHSEDAKCSRGNSVVVCCIFCFSVWPRLTAPPPHALLIDGRGGRDGGSARLQQAVVVRSRPHQHSPGRLPPHTRPMWDFPSHHISRPAFFAFKRRRNITIFCRLRCSRESAVVWLRFPLHFTWCFSFS